MKITYVTIIAIVLVVIAVGIAGCTGTTPTTSGTGTTPASTTIGSNPSGSSSVPSVGSVVSGANLFGTTSYKWFEYKATSKEMVSDIKTEVSQETYKGQAATHTRMTSTITTPMAATTVTDMYVASGVSLGGHMKMVSNGQTVMDQDIPPTDTSKVPASPNTDKTVQYTFAGIEPVTVPAGTYPAAMKYTATIQGSTSTYWTTPGVPLFVKMVMTSSSGDITEELVGWG